MGFLDHTTNSIVVDAVLTDTGRELLSRSNGGLQILSYAFADPEVDYSNLQKYGDIIGSEKIIKNTPIYEATTNSKIAKFYTNSLLYSSEDGTNSLSIDSSASNLVTSGLRGDTLTIPVTWAIGGSPTANLLWRVYYDSSLLENVKIDSNGFASPITWSGDIMYVEIETGSPPSGTVIISADWKTSLSPSLSTMSAITIQEDAISGLSIQQTLNLTT